MATKVYKICDRCSAQFERTDGSGVHKVQEFKWFLPISDHLHQTGENKQELCTPCRKMLSEIIWNFLKKT